MSATSASSSISGEIESGTFESLLLTPVTHRQIAMQKLLSVLTVWALLYLVSIPYLVVVASGTHLALSAVLYVSLYGTLLVTGLSLISIAISARLKSSKSSIMTTLMIVLILLAPSLFFATSLKKTDFGLALESINPVSQSFNSLDSVLVDNEQVSLQVDHVWPVVVFVLACLLVFVFFTRQFEVKSAALALNLVANNNNDDNENLADSVGMDVAVAVSVLFTVIFCSVLMSGCITTFSVQPVFAASQSSVASITTPLLQAMSR